MSCWSRGGKRTGKLQAPNPTFQGNTKFQAPIGKVEGNSPKSLYINWAAGDAEGGFAHGFAEGWMGVASASEVFAARAKGDRGGGFVDQIARMGTDNVNAENAI